MTLVAVLVGVAFVLALYFPVRYAFARPWRSSDVGRSAWVFSVIVAAVLLLAFLRTLGVILPAWLRAGSYVLIAVGLLYQDVALTRALRRRRDGSG